MFALALPAFGRDAFFPGGVTDAGLFAWFRLFRCVPEQSDQPHEGVFAVTFLRTVAFRLDNDCAVPGCAPAGEF